MWTLLPALTLLSASAAPVDRIVAVVGGELVLASDLTVDELLDPCDASPSEFWTLPTRDRTQRLIDAALLRQRAGDLPIYQPGREALANRLAYVRATHPELERQLAQAGIEPELLDTAIRRRMIVERVLARDIIVQAAGPDAWSQAMLVLIRQVRESGRVRRVPAVEPP